jgi:hypothetical protein
MPAMMSKVDADLALSTVISTPFFPSSCTTLVWGGLPSCAKATSRGRVGRNYRLNSVRTLAFTVKRPAGMLLCLFRVFAPAIVPPPVSINSFLVRGGREACFRDRRIKPLINSTPVPMSNEHFGWQLVDFRPRFRPCFIDGPAWN